MSTVHKTSGRNPAYPIFYIHHIVERERKVLPSYISRLDCSQVTFEKRLQKHVQENVSIVHKTSARTATYPHS